MPDWLDRTAAALRTARRGRNLRVVFQADPAHLWRVITELPNEHLAPENGLFDWVPAQPWNAAFLRQWCMDQGLNEATQKIEELLKLTGGWPLLLERYAKSKKRTWQEKADEVEVYIARNGEELLDEVGLGVAEARLQLGPFRAWQEDLDSSNWADWRQFLEDYAQASRSRSLLGRSRFLVALAGPPAAEPPPMEVGIENLAWNGVIEDLDLLLFANEQLRPRVDEPLLRSLLANAVAKVAAWDFDTAAAIVAEDNATIMNPCELLRANARERGWTTDTPLDLCLGTCLGGIAHPVRAALDEPPNELHRRLWSAQLSVLLPWIERVATLSWRTTCMR